MRNGYDVTQAEYNTRSSIGRLSDDRVVCNEVRDAQEPARSTLDGRELNLTARRRRIAHCPRHGSHNGFDRY